MTSISVHIDGNFDFEVDAVWPDGDAPDVVDADAVIAQIRKCSNVGRFLDEWGLEPEIDVHVTVRCPTPSNGGTTVGWAFGPWYRIAAARARNAAIG